ncbi:MAG: ABC transporter ATP-binding protein [Bacteroidota bacterium]|nr:ABC transporter ATP-binding protein [Bacteroidota bacterium]MDP3144516.1 ABC transporter ATP-binding protein [Bacteroidota bacterium]MDP3555803.1 ABC transporter ATP-binding protein [Bacteroidota bacterium]
MSNAEQNKGLNFKLLKRILSYTQPYKQLFYGAVFFTLIIASLAIVRPLLISKALNEYVTNAKDFEGLNSICLIILSLLFIEAFLQILNLRITNLLGQNIVKDLRNQVYKHIIQLKNSYFDTTPVGTLVTRAISDIESLSDVFAQGFIVIVGDIVMLLIFVSVMFANNWVLTLLALSTIPLLFIATAVFKRGVKKTFTLVRNAVSALNTFTQEHITGMRLVQLFNREEQELEKFKEINRQHRVANIKAIFYYSVFFPIVEILSSVSIALIIWFVGVKGNSYQIGLGDITFFIMMINMLFRPIRMLADRLNTLQMGIVSAERVFKVLDTNEKITNEGTINFEGVKQTIEFKNVSFAYTKDHYVLNNISFSIKAGETIALVGSTGAGKSTVINLFSRFYDFENGEILIDGINIRQFDLISLRKNTGVVLQDVFMFNDTLLNNITLSNPDIKFEDVVAATKQIGLYDYILSLPNGFDYQVTERGQGLSAGQRQLVAFIRAFVYQPSIFILDEATATIDTQTEQLIQKATEKISEGRTSIIIAHRLSTIKHVDKILVFDQGKIIEEGSIQELLNSDSKFKKLYELNNKEEVI